MILLQAAGAGYGQFVMLAAIFVVFYFFMIRPQQKKAKDAKEFLAAVKKGDRVVTIGGLHGRILEIDELTIVLEVDRNTRITFDRASISMESTKKIAAKETVS